MDPKDFLGNPLVVGDVIAASSTGYLRLKLYEVIGFTPRKIKVVSVDVLARGELTRELNFYSQLKSPTDIILVKAAGRA